MLDIEVSVFDFQFSAAIAVLYFIYDATAISARSHKWPSLSAARHADFICPFDMVFCCTYSVLRLAFHYL